MHQTPPPSPALPHKGLSDAHIFPSLSNGLCPKSQNSISCARCFLARSDLNWRCKYLIGDSFLRCVRCVNRTAEGEGGRRRGRGGVRREKQALEILLDPPPGLASRDHPPLRGGIGGRHPYRTNL